MKKRGKTKIVFDQTYSAQNFNTSPVTVSGLKGDSYDYTFILYSTSASVDNKGWTFRCNSDTGSNYRRYYLYGRTSTASAAVTDAATYIMPSDTNDYQPDPTFMICTISGSSGDERYFDFFSGNQYGSTKVWKASGYWKNTADELTSLTFGCTGSSTIDARIIIYRSPKIASQGRWQLMKKLSWSASSSEQSLTGLDGDTDKQFMIKWIGDQELNIELNNDAGSNYTREYIQNSGGSISSANSTTNTSIVTDGIESRIIINAESGVKRLCTSSASNTSAAQQSERAVWWSNTADNLTGLYLTPAASATGDAWIYRAKNPYTTADLLPFQTIKTVAVSGDFSAGHTFNVSGNDYKLIKIEFIGTGPSNNMLVQFNSDTGSNYTRQYLQASSSSTTAGTSTTTSYSLTEVINSSTTAGTMYIYPPSGDNRPILSTMQIGTSITQHKAGWWLNSGDNLTSVKVYGSTSGSITGEIKFSVLK